MNQTGETIAIGQILKPHGLRGEAKVRSLSDVPGRLETLGQVLLASVDGCELSTTVTRVRSAIDSYVMGFQAFTSPEELTPFRGALIKIPRDRVREQLSDRFYHCDLIGLQVRTEADELLGIMDEVLETPGNHVFVVNGLKGEILIPATKEIVIGVNFQARVMTIRPLAGLLPADD